ncbi:hypothetical protein RAS2_06440 [Phycisphaerae bacterium RAS2]|nr:hypothetical protein RAS2_06440 [Phycisphaerae bacterium RAS2]
MNPQLTMFGQNIFLLIGIAMLLAIIAIVLFAAVMGWRVWRFQRQQHDVDREFEKFTGKPPSAKPDAADLPPDPNLPPMAQGICNECGRVFPKVYHLPDGERLCKSCFSKRPAKA